MGFLKWIDEQAEKQKERDRKLIELKQQQELEKKQKEEELRLLNPKAYEKKKEKERIKQLDKEHIPYCPKCHSTSITYVNKKLSLGRTVVGGAIGTLAGPLGVAAGATMGGLSSKKGKVKCLNCGHTWKL